MRTAITAVVAALLAVLATNVLSVAVAEAPTVTSTRTVSVEGVGTAPIGQGDNAADATAAYRNAMGAAVADGQTKASFLTGKAGATIGAVQNIVEGGGSIACTTNSSYAEYEGEQPDFGSAPEPTAVSPLSGTAHRAPANRTPSKRPKRKRTKAKPATAASCTVTAQVLLVYSIS